MMERRLEHFPWQERLRKLSFFHLEKMCLASMCKEVIGKMKLGSLQ